MSAVVLAHIKPLTKCDACLKDATTQVRIGIKAVNLCKDCEAVLAEELSKDIDKA